VYGNMETGDKRRNIKDEQTKSSARDGIAM
jgi:hypothetical protein